jgi:hypothetical protein
MITNLTPHAMLIYPPDIADRIDSTTVPDSRIHVIASSTDCAPVRLGHTVTVTVLVHDGIPVEDVVFGSDTTAIDWLPASRPGNRYVVSLVVGLAAAPYRDDLLVSRDYVRDLGGAIIGSR